MKIALLIGLNVLVVGAGILAYDVLRGETTTPEERARETARIDDVLERLDVIERRLDGVERGDGDRRLSTRLLQLEGRIGALESGRRVAEATAAATPEDVDAAAAMAAAAAAPPADAPVDADAPLADPEIERVKKALQEVEAQREQERAAEMADGLAARLGLSLTDDQRKRLGTELSAFRDRARDTFRNARGAGMTREDALATFDELRGELTTKLEDFLPVSDAKAITDEIGNGPRMMIGGGPGGPGGPGGGR
jgi:hypothetical protein